MLPVIGPASRNAAGVVDSVHKLLHVGRVNSFRDAVSEDVDSPAGESELQSGNHHEIGTRERLAMLDVSMHSNIVEHLGMIAHCELHGDRMAVLDPPPGFTAPCKTGA